MAELCFKKPCNDCPFRRVSLAGWTGSAEPEWFTGIALSENPGDNPCHQTVDYDDASWKDRVIDGDVPVCAGSLIFARNCGKLPRDPEQANLLQQVERDTETVFASPQEFIDHHRQHDGMGSWMQ